MRWLTVLLILALPLAGCLGDDDEPTGPTDLPDDPPDEAPLDENVSATERRSQSFEGSVTTVNFVAGSLNAQGDTVQELTVADGALVLQVNLTAEGGELDLLVAAPDCEPNSGCEDRVATQGGTAQFEVNAPDAGSWTLRFFGNQPGPSQVSYVAEVGQVVVVTG